MSPVDDPEASRERRECRPRGFVSRCTLRRDRGAPRIGLPMWNRVGKYILALTYRGSIHRVP